jgi:hypothetical protein
MQGSFMCFIKPFLSDKWKEISKPFLKSLWTFQISQEEKISLGHIEVF